MFVIQSAKCHDTGMALRQSGQSLGTGQGKTLRAKIVDELREAILRGVYRVGTPLGEVELAHRFGTSRGPVREALIELQKEALVRSYSKRGTFVNALTESELDEIMNLRSVLEPMAMEAARRKSRPAGLQHLRTVYLKMEENAVQGRVREFIEADEEFHLTLWQLAEQPILEQVLDQISRPAFAFFRINWMRYQDGTLNLPEVARSHLQILDFLEKKTDMSAVECFRPVIEETIRDEKPVLLRP